VKAFIGSANLTEAAQLRNIEIGLVTANAAITGAVERHIEALIAGGHLRPVPLGGDSPLSLSPARWKRSAVT
jgi:phosphatidylserine/phosphatidylglycerophosphate/cardiolipin synthase-like enzyme